MYAQFISNKKGPLAKIWLAAHWDKKLTKAQIYETNIESTIEAILEPNGKNDEIALRTSGHLLLGVCRIYSRKVKYLLADCNEAFVKIKLAFRPGLIDLPKEKQQASVEAITLPEKFPDLTLTMSFSDHDLNMDDLSFSKNISTQQARIEDITLKEDFGTLIQMQDDDFGGMMDMDSFGMDMDTFMMSDMEKGRKMGASLIAPHGPNNAEMDFFDDQSINNHFANSDLSNQLQDISKQTNNADVIPMDMNDLNQREFASNLDNPQLNSANEETLLHDDENQEMGISTINGQTGVVPTLFDDPTVNNTNVDEPLHKLTRLGDLNEIEEEEEANKLYETENVQQRDDDDDNNNNNNNQMPVQTIEKRQANRQKRRNKLIIDDTKEIDSNAMKAQLSDTRAILGTLELAPPTRKLMLWKETGGVDKLFSMPRRAINSKPLLALYTRNMQTKSLVDITNQNRAQYLSDKAKNETLKEDELLCTSKHIDNYLNNQDVSTVEANVGAAHQTSKHVLPLVDSFIDNNQETSKRNLNNTTLNQTSTSNDDFMDTSLGDRAQSVYNPHSMDDILEPQMNLEVTPGKDQSSKMRKHEELESSDSADEGESPSSRGNKSPKQKRSYHKKSSTKESSQLTKDDLDLDNLDETLSASNDPNKHLTKRAKAMVSLLNKSLTKYDNVAFGELIKKNPKKSVVQKFYSLLVLTKYEIIEVTQDETYGEIIISKGEKFDSFQSTNTIQN